MSERHFDVFYRGLKAEPQQVIEMLKPVLLDKRRLRIDEVIQSRIYRLPIVLEDVFNLGNSSAILRTAEALGFFNIHVIRNYSGAKLSPRTTQGAESWLNIKKWEQSLKCVEALKAQGYKILSTDVNATTSLDEWDLKTPTALVFGNEVDGVTKEISERADGTFSLPMLGFTKSYNVSVAAGLCLTQVRDRLGWSYTDLTEGEKMSLKARYYFNSVRNADAYFREAREISHKS